jgi:cell division protein FtsB
VKKKKKEKKPSRLKKVAYSLSLALVFGMCAYVLLPGFSRLEKVRTQIAELRRTYDEKQLHNETLKVEIESMYTSEGIERAARQHLRLAKPDEVVVVFVPSGDRSSAE